MTNRMPALIDKLQETLDAMRTELVASDPPFVPAEAPWMPLALGEVGVLEDSDPGEDNPRVLEYLATCTRLPDDMQAVDETPWCSAYVNWCVTKAGVPGTGSARARSWLQWGHGLLDFKYGCVVILERPPSTTSGHVGFYMGRAKHGAIKLLSGNSNNRVRESDYSADRVLGLRWPSGRIVR